MWWLYDAAPSVAKNRIAAMTKDQDLLALTRRLKAFELVSDFYANETIAGTPAAVETLKEALEQHGLWHGPKDAAFFDTVAKGAVPSSVVFFHVLEEEPTNGRST
jgi:hypothetical protein